MRFTLTHSSIKSVKSGVGLSQACYLQTNHSPVLYVMKSLVRDAVLPRNVNGESGLFFDPCVNAMEWRSFARHVWR